MNHRFGTYAAASQVTLILDEPAQFFRPALWGSQPLEILASGDKAKPCAIFAAPIERGKLLRGADLHVSPRSG